MCFISQLNHYILGVKCVSKHQDLQIFVLKVNKYEVVGCGSKTQLQYINRIRVKMNVND